MNEELEQQLLTLSGAMSVEKRSDGLWMTAPDLDVAAAARLMLQHGARLSTMTAVALDGGESEVIYHYAKGNWSCQLRVKTQNNSLTSITPITPAADWIEREINDLYAVTFSGHPNPKRLVRPAQLQPGYFREPGGSAGKKLRESERR